VSSASTTSATGVLSVTHAATSTVTEAGNTVDFSQPGRLGTRP
jgi:hypothetical protein